MNHQYLSPSFEIKREEDKQASWLPPVLQARVVTQQWTGRVGQHPLVHGSAHGMETLTGRGGENKALPQMARWLYFPGQPSIDTQTSAPTWRRQRWVPSCFRQKGKKCWCERETRNGTFDIGNTTELLIVFFLGSGMRTNNLLQILHCSLRANLCHVTPCTVNSISCITRDMQFFSSTSDQEDHPFLVGLNRLLHKPGRPQHAKS